MYFYGQHVIIEQRLAKTMISDIVLSLTWLSYNLGLALVQILIFVSPMIPKILKLPKQNLTPTGTQIYTKTDKLQYEKKIMKLSDKCIVNWTPGHSR